MLGVFVDFPTFLCSLRTQLFRKVIHGVGTSLRALLPPPVPTMRNPRFDPPRPSLPPSLPPCLSVEKSHGFLHSVADSMRESSGIARHDAPKPSVQLPEGEAPEPGTVEKIKASISGVAGASQVLGWGAHGSKGEKVKVEGSAPSVEMGAPSVEAGAAGADVSVSAPSVDVDASAAVPSVEGDVSVPSASAEGGLKLPSGSTDVGGCEFLFLLLFCEDPPVVRKGAFCLKHVSCV